MCSVRGDTTNPAYSLFSLRISPVNNNKDVILNLTKKKNKLFSTEKQRKGMMRGLIIKMGKAGMQNLYNDKRRKSGNAKR